MAIRTLLLMSLSLIYLAGCASKSSLETSFNPNEAAFINSKGDSELSGQAFLKTMIGEVRYAAGNEVALIPVTSYSSERIAKIYGSGKCSKLGKNFENEDPAYHQFIKKTKANGEGRFVFKNLAPGEYFVVTSVHWQIPGNLFPEGCGLYERVQIDAGDRKELILTGS